MITEDYVSFEVAKLLKEKGFDKKCDYAYCNDWGNKTIEFGLKQNKNSIYELGGYNGAHWEYVSAPTHQMATKWLRKVHNLHIFADYESDRGFQPNIIDLKTGANKINEMYNGYTNEQAVEVALKFTLENLI